MGATTRYYGFYAVDALELTPQLTLTAGLRINAADIVTRDRSGLASELNGAHGYGHANPLVGLTWQAGAAAQSTADRLPGIVTGSIAPELAAASEMERVTDDLWALGLTPDATAIALLRDELDQRGIARASALGSIESPRVMVAGVVTHRQHPETANGAVFINLEDETGHVNVIFSKGAWARWSSVARASPALVIRGSLQRGQGSVALAAEFVESLHLANVTLSRDWR